MENVLPIRTKSETWNKSSITLEVYSCKCCPVQCMVALGEAYVQSLSFGFCWLPYCSSPCTSALIFSISLRYFLFPAWYLLPVLNVCPILEGIEKDVTLAPHSSLCKLQCAVPLTFLLQLELSASQTYAAFTALCFQVSSP